MFSIFFGFTLFREWPIRERQENAKNIAAIKASTDFGLVEFGISKNIFNLFFETAIRVVDRCLAL